MQQNRTGPELGTVCALILAGGRKQNRGLATKPLILSLALAQLLLLLVLRFHNGNELLDICMDVGCRQRQKSFTFLIIPFPLYAAGHARQPVAAECSPRAGLCASLLYILYTN